MDQQGLGHWGYGTLAVIVDTKSSGMAEVLPGIAGKSAQKVSCHCLTIPLEAGKLYISSLTQITGKSVTQLRVPDIHEAQKHTFFTICLIFLSIHDVSKI